MLLSHLAGCRGDGRRCVCTLCCISNLLPRLAPEMPAVGGHTNPDTLERRGGKGLSLLLYLYYEKH